MEQVLQVENLSFGYAGVQVLRHVGFSISAGDYVGIIGSNGAGKSTLLRLLLGELPPTEGEVRLFGKPVQRFRDWPALGYVPQNPAVLAAGFPATAAELVASSLYAHTGPFRFYGRAGREKVREALAAVGMEEVASRRIGELSGGQLQRVMLARAMAGRPRLMLLDEPATGVDAKSVEYLYGMLANMNRDGVTILMVTHDLHRAAEHFHRAFCLEEGTIVELDRDQLAHEAEHRHRHP